MTDETDESTLTSTTARRSTVTAEPTDTASSRPRATSTRRASQTTAPATDETDTPTLSAESVDVSLPGLEMEDGEGQVMLRYDGRSLVLYNRAPSFVDVSDLDFVASSGDGEALFNSNDWENSQIYLFRSANCFQLWTKNFAFLESDEFPADVCDYRQAYQQIDVPFWVGDAKTTFAVERDGMPLGVCPVVPRDDRDDNRCIITLP
jgi:hypothetical protein